MITLFARTFAAVLVRFWFHFIFVVYNFAILKLATHTAICTYIYFTFIMRLLLLEDRCCAGSIKIMIF